MVFIIFKLFGHQIYFVKNNFNYKLFPLIYYELDFLNELFHYFIKFFNLIEYNYHLNFFKLKMNFLFIFRHLYYL